MMYKCKFSNYNQHSHFLRAVDNGKDHVQMWGKSPYLPLNLVMNLKEKRLRRKGKKKRRRSKSRRNWENVPHMEADLVVHKSLEQGFTKHS